jgi:hypothetical protein
MKVLLLRNNVNHMSMTVLEDEGVFPVFYALVGDVFNQSVFWTSVMGSEEGT